MSRFKPVIPSSMSSNYNLFHFAPAVIVDNRVYASGQLGVGADGKVSDDLETQFTNAFERVGEVLEAAGVSFADVVEISTFHIGLQSNIQQFIAVKDRFITEPYPAWTAVGTTELAIPGAVVEIKVIAHI